MTGRGLVEQLEIMIYSAELKVSTWALMNAWEVTHRGVWGLWQHKVGSGSKRASKLDSPRAVLGSDKAPKLKGKEELTTGCDGLGYFQW